MNCESVQDLLPLYLSGELTGETLAAVQLHIQACEACSKALSTDRELDDALRTAMLEDTPDVSVVLRRVHAGMTTPGWKRMLSLVSLRAAGVAAAIALIAWLVLLRLPVHQVQRTLALNAANDHYSDLVLLRHADWAHNPQEVARFIQVNFSQRKDLLEEITPPDASFEKVRLCRLGAAQYAHFVFRNGTIETSVFLAPTVQGSSQYQTYHMAEAGYGLEVSEFFSPHVTGMVVSNKGLVPTEEMANRLAKTL